MMKVPKKSDIPHKLALYKLLEELLSDAFIANNVYFKGGSCAAMLGYLDRFSIDLDFDLLDRSKKKQLRGSIHKILKKVDYQIKDESQKHLQFFIKYRDAERKRNTLKLEISDLVSKENEYEKVRLIEIDKYCQAQTVDTMFANKLVALKARWDEGKRIAGRDMYDVQYFFEKEYEINKGVIEDIRGVSFSDYIKELIDFVEKKVSEKILWEDLNPLLPKQRLQKTVPYLKRGVLLALKECF